jgi:ParB-like chromosome segregation protein Spo0J
LSGKERSLFGAGGKDKVSLSLFSEVSDEITAKIIAEVKKLGSLPVKDRAEAINAIRLALHEISPFAAEPVDCVLWVPAEKVQGNNYNPNHVAPPEMKLLEISINADGFTQPVVAHRVKDGYEVIDGFHRTRVTKENKGVRARLHGYLPLTLIKQNRTRREDRIAATIRHNRARGEHGVRPMTEIVAELKAGGLDDDAIAKGLGMDADEVLRFLQNKGLPELFSRHEYSKSWEGA